MEDLLGLLHFRDFATLLQLQQQQQQRGQQQPSQQLQRFPAKQLISCCLPVLLQLHDSYSSPCNSLKVLVSQFSTREVDASRRLHRLAAPAAAAGAAAAAPAVTAATTVTSATAETTKAVTAATAATTDDEVATTEGDLAGSAQQHKMSCLWEVGGPLGPTDEAVSEQALGAVLNRFKADTSAFAAAASAAAGPCAATAGPAETGIVAAGIKVWGPFLPLLLPILYPLLPSSISEQSDAEGVHGRQDQGQQTSRQERPQGAPSIPHSVKGPLAEETASATAAPVAALALVSAPGGTKQEASAAAAATVSATAPAAPSSTTRAGALATAEVTATRRAALCLCAAALMWWGRQKLGGPTAEAEEHARVLLLGPAFADAELALAKPFLSLILNSPTTQDALTVGRDCVAVLLEGMRASSFSLASPLPLVLRCLAGLSLSFSQLLTAALSSPELPLNFSTVALLQLACASSAEDIAVALCRNTLTLNCLRGPPGAPSRGLLRPGTLAQLLLLKKGPPHLKAQLVLSYYILCIDLEQQQTQRLLAAAANGGAVASLQHFAEEAAAVSNALQSLFHECSQGPPGVPAASAGSPALYVGATSASLGLPSASSGAPSASVGEGEGEGVGISFDCCGLRWGPFAVAEMLGLLDLRQAPAAAAKLLHRSLPRALLLMLLCCSSQPAAEEQTAFTETCGLILGDCMQQQDQQAELVQRLGALISTQLFGGPQQQPWQQQQRDSFPASTAEEVHAILRALIPQALAVSPCLSLRGPNSLLFRFIFNGFLHSWQAWGLQSKQPQQQQQEEQETDAVMEVLSAQTNYARSSLLQLLSPLLSESSACVSHQQQLQQRDTAELLGLQCWLFVCECGLHAFAAALNWGAKEALKQQVQQDGGCFFSLPYAALQRWQHLVAAAAAFLESNTNPPNPLAAATLSSLLDYPEVLTALQQYSFPSAAVAAAAATSVLTEGEAAAVQRESCSSSCVAIMLLYTIAKVHKIPYFRARDCRYLRRLHSLPWQSALHFLSSHPTLSHWMLRLFTEALHECLPEKASLDYPFSPVSPLLLLQQASAHPGAFIAADAALPLERAVAGLALESFPLAACSSRDSESKKQQTFNTLLPSAGAVQRCVSLWMQTAVAASPFGRSLAGGGAAAEAAASSPAFAAAAAVAAAEADGEALQLFVASEPLAGISSAICCLINFFFENVEENCADAPAACGDFSPTADDVPTDAAAPAAGDAAAAADAVTLAKEAAALFSIERLAVVPPRFSEALLDSYYLCVVQNPLRLLLQLPASILQHLLAANLLHAILNLLLLKLEVYTRMGAPTLAGQTPPPIAAEEIIQLQETAALQVLIEACLAAGTDERLWEMVGFFLDSQCFKRPQGVEGLFVCGFALEAVDKVCCSCSSAQRMLPLLSRLLQQKAALLWRNAATEGAAAATTAAVPAAAAAHSDCEDLPDPAEGVHVLGQQSATVHPALQPLSRVDLCLFYLKCIVCVACDLRHNKPYPGESRETDPTFAAETANAVFLEAIKHYELCDSASLCEFVAAAVPVIFPLFYTFPKLAALVNTFLAHKKLLRHDGSMKASPAASANPATGAATEAAATATAALGPSRPNGQSLSKLRADAVLEQLEQDLSRVIELDL